ncbi:TatD family hydrolase [Sediminitomix flava]|uniref:TatD DNase family protein n=1 Tax=Sediminitomix flava TaxID=379075 RepID=A0A315ZC84_SEDFL|nr:TatD family hydrolase [Sediminitomix flava]PWJ42930.1 TatD DNase family protein [Sediminitomix flava]
MIDTHAHIYSSKFEDDREQMLELAFSEGVKKIFMPNIDHESIDGMMELEEKYKGICYSMMGLHPCSVGKDFEKELYIVEDWLSKREFIAVGEMGLDFYWDKTYIEQQKEAFRIQAEWAKKYGIPLVIHSRDAMAETIELLEELKDDKLFGVLHCFAGTAEEAQRLKELDFKIGLGGVITYKNGGMNTVVPEIDLNEIVLETDCPYLPPVPKRGKRNEPSFIKYIADKVSDYKEVSVEEVERITTENALALFSKAQ